jgi:beta-lactamase superfamily II metal-dependent hydrolase
MIKGREVEIRLFDVTHGFCAYVVADNGNVMLIDCGHNQDSGFRPSTYLPNRGCNGIERFFVTNYDGDHLSDLPNLRTALPINILRRNASITADQLRSLKLQGGPIRPGMQALLDMIRTYTGTVTHPPEYPNVDWKVFYNDYPTFKDVNNLSLVLFLHYGKISIVFPGDLERAGWLALLKNRSFRDELSRVHYFVASHHGRESGYCQEVFDYCSPEIAIISDGPVRYATQSTDYGSHARGIRFNSGLRRVLATRKDGMITISQRPEDSRPYISTAR